MVSQCRGRDRKLGLTADAARLAGLTPFDISNILRIAWHLTSICKELAPHLARHRRETIVAEDKRGVAPEPEDVLRCAEMFAALGAAARLRVLLLLLAAHPAGMVVGDIQAKLDIPGSTLSHHLERLRQEALVAVTRQGTYLRYAANTETLRDLLGFLYAECCTLDRAVEPQEVMWVGRQFRNERR